MPLVQNPILTGFHPDPSICRVGSDYYLATSTFEWWPGVRLHHSTDLVTWTLIGGALDRPSQLSIRGNPDSGGVWAPALSHADGLFWLIYSDVKSFDGPVKDLRNYLVTAPRIEGPWSDPVPLNSSGFDPSLFHDDDGRKYLLNQLWVPRADCHPFAGVILQEYDPRLRRLIGPRTLIFEGTSLRVTEGPHLLKRDGYYWLITAEGGTAREHAVTIARSRSLLGPYEVHPANPVLTSVHEPDWPLQNAGHASLCDTPAGDWFLVHLCTRPRGRPARAMLGRETALQRLVWPAGGWPSLAHGGRLPALEVLVPGSASEAPPRPAAWADDFKGASLHPNWNTLREAPDPAWLSLSGRPGWLRLRGRHSLMSTFDQSLVACRLTAHEVRAEVTLDFFPDDAGQRAGLALYYDTRNHACAYVTADGRGGRELRVWICDNRQVREHLTPPLALPATGSLRLTAELREGMLRFFFATEEGAAPTPAGEPVPATFLGDEHSREGGLGFAFTGTFVALCAQDSSDLAPVADFSAFRIENLG